MYVDNEATNQIPIFLDWLETEAFKTCGMTVGHNYL
jgi:hypothetical protein